MMLLSRELEKDRLDGRLEQQVACSVPRRWRPFLHDKRLP